MIYFHNNEPNDYEERTFYGKFDNFIMSKVNKFVRSYNWLTGNTKEKLANHVVGGGTIIGTSGSFSGGFVSDHPLGDLVGGFISLGTFITGCVYTNHNSVQQNLEEESKEKECKSLEVENDKETRKNNLSHNCLNTLGSYSLGGLFYLGEEPGISALFCSFGTFNVSLIISDYIMRAEDVPPGKNAFKRGWEKIKDVSENIEESPSPVPEPAPNAVKYGLNLESRL